MIGLSDPQQMKKNEKVVTGKLSVDNFQDSRHAEIIFVVVNMAGEDAKKKTTSLSYCHS